MHGVQEARDIIKRLLTHNPTQRLGSGKGGASDVKAHAWFSGFDWAAFAKRQLKAPYVPQVILSTSLCLHACAVMRSWLPGSCTRAAVGISQMPDLHRPCHANMRKIVESLKPWLLQVSSQEDTRNFSGGTEEMHASMKGKKYVSTGVFRDF